MINPINAFGIWWLSGAKYDYSRWRAGPAWDYPIKEVLSSKRIDIDKCYDMHDVVRMFLGKIFWEQDKVYSIYDTVESAWEIVLTGGDDCDGLASLHAQSMDHVLSKRGWDSHIITYLSNPFQLSHHFCALTEPNGTRWVVQPQPTKDAWSDPQKSKQVIFGPWSAGTSDLKLAETVLSWYDPKATVVWTDTRGPKYEKLS